MTPQQFIAQWGPGGPGYALIERQGAQAHFMDLCAWLAAAHQALDAAVAAAYGWADYTADMPDDEILRRLLALNLARAASD